MLTVFRSRREKTKLFLVSGWSNGKHFQSVRASRCCEMLCNHSTCKLDLSKIRSCCVISLPKRHFSSGHYLPLMKCWKLFLSQVTVVKFHFDFLISFFWRYKPLMFFWEFELNSEWQQNTLSEFFWSIKSKSRVNGRQPDDSDKVLKMWRPIANQFYQKNMMLAEVQNLQKYKIYLKKADIINLGTLTSDTPAYGKRKTFSSFRQKVSPKISAYFWHLTRKRLINSLRLCYWWKMFRMEMRWVLSPRSRCGSKF